MTTSGEAGLPPADESAEGEADEVVPSNRVADELASIRAEMRDLSAAVAEIRIDTQRIDEYRRLRSMDAEMLDKLHRENTDRHNGQLAKAMTPLFHGLIKLYDLIATVQPLDEKSTKLLVQLVQILELNGVQVYQPRHGEPFDSKRQNGVGRTPTDAPDADGKVARTTQPGFLSADAVLRPASVEVYRLHLATDSPAAR